MKTMSYVVVELTLTLVIAFFLCFLPIVTSAGGGGQFVIPSDKAQVESWFNKNFGEGSAVKASLQPAAISGATPPKVISVNAGGGGDFKTVTDAIGSVPTGNKQRVIIKIGPGNYTEKITIPRDKPFITLYGADPKNMPVLVYAGTAAKYGTVDSGTLSIDSEHFMGVNLKVVNSAPRPDGKKVGAQAVAVKVGGDASVFYNCKLYGFQDTLMDYKGRHFFKDCYIEGTVDFVFGSAKSIYLNCELHVISGDGMAMISAQARSDNKTDTGFVFVHCRVTGTGGVTTLGRSWYPYPRVIYAFCDLSDAIKPEGWSNNFKPETNSTVFFGEYNNKGPGASWEKRVTFAKKLTDAEVKPYLNLDFIDASTWLLPPIKL